LFALGISQKGGFAAERGGQAPEHMS